MRLWFRRTRMEPVTREARLAPGRYPVRLVALEIGDGAACLRYELDHVDGVVGRTVALIVPVPQGTYVIDEEA